MKAVDAIINADDLGISLEVNEAIFALMDEGLVTSATVIANAPHVEEACEHIGRHSQCSFGVHLNLTEFRPITGPRKLESLLDDRGAFVKERIRQVSLGSRVADGIYEELCAQIERLQSLGVEIGHIDSHHHVHTIPAVFRILKKVRKRFQIGKVRLTRNIYGLHEDTPRFLRGKKSIYNFLLRHYLPATTTQGFTDFKTFHECATANRIKHRTIELMVHPGYSNDEYYKNEIQLLRGPWRQMLDYSVRLVSYADLR